MTEATILQKPAHNAAQAGLTDNQKMLIEMKLANEAPNIGVAYLIWFVIGTFGGHRFYLGHKKSGIAMLVISLTFYGLIITAIWSLVDLFLIPSIVRERVDQVRQRLLLEQNV